MLITLIAACDREPSPNVPAQSPIESPAIEVPPQVTAPGPQPVPTMGGGLALDEEGLAWMSDPDTGRVLRVDTLTGIVLASLDLGRDAVPNRLVVTPTHVAVVARGLGGVAIANRTDLVPTVVPTCREPRGITAFDASTAWVACADGVLAKLDLPSAQVTTSLSVELDLRDVLPDGDTLRVTRFKSAELLTVDPSTGAVLARTAPPTVTNREFGKISRRLSPFSPFAAWRTIPDPRGGWLMVHLRGTDSEIPIDEDDELPTDLPYGGSSVDCGESIVHAAVTRFSASGEADTSAPIGSIGVPVDVAVDAYGTIRLAVLGSSGNTVAVTLAGDPFDSSGCGQTIESAAPGHPHGDAIVARPGGGFVYSHRFPLGVDGWLLSDESAPAGFDLFHRSTVAGLSCAACHPEGHEDGRTWSFDWDGLRRTQDLAGGISSSEPFHWDGVLGDLDDLVVEVHQRRMGGAESTPAQVADLSAFLDAIPALRAPVAADPVLVGEGELLFHDPAVGCAQCHTDPPPAGGFRVGTSPDPLQVPRLAGTAYRGPWLHDGCASTLRERFDPACGGSDHGQIDALDDHQIDALVAWLASQ